MENTKRSLTPMSTSTKLEKERDEEEDCKYYLFIIGVLSYLTASRSDIMYSVYLCARFQSCPKTSHLKVTKQILRYLIDTAILGLWYPKESLFDLHAYSDADYGGCRFDRKSTSDTCQFLRNMLIS
ncbi:hypothetical protein CFOL_v3_17233 [Cephalotus follicularis]|uniref:RVT_2 domain-containing protein n=1 Tax=Cephalotus follicularis TaxID=3775 RepID=A0A1Q3C0H1_CEPFO|nr:hypothetical protein CFOL_v3_17233 [Cephalotus follicularis]